MRWWRPPDPLAFTAEEVAQVIEAGGARSPSDVFFGRPVGELTGPAALGVLDRLQTAAEKITEFPIGFVSFAAVLEYPAGAGGLPWHRDRLADDRPGDPDELTNAAERVLSCTVQLSGPDDYQGGDLETDEGPAPKDRGAVVFFPSTLRHRVTPVVAGCRLSLIAFWPRSRR